MLTTSPQVDGISTNTVDYVLFVVTGNAGKISPATILSARALARFCSGEWQIAMRIAANGSLCSDAAWYGLVKVLPGGDVEITLPSGKVKHFARGTVVPFDLVCAFAQG